MSSHLYTRDILRLATSLAGQRRLSDFHASADRRSPTCGSRVIVDVKLDDAHRILELGMEVSACALGQASAALLAAHALGRTPAEIANAAEALRCYLTSSRDDVNFWPGAGVFASAKAYPARHPSILLAFQATRDAAADALVSLTGQAA